MAKILMENKFILTRKLHKQYCKDSYYKRRKGTRIMSFVLALICALVTVLFLIFYRNKVAITVSLMMVLYFVLMAFYGYLFSEMINYRSLQKQHGKAVVMVVQFSPVQVFVRVNKTSFAFKYQTITGAYETEDLIVLILSRKGMIEHSQIIYKRGFGEAGSEIEFKQLINEKTGLDIFDVEQVTDRLEEEDGENE